MTDSMVDVKWDFMMKSGDLRDLSDCTGRVADEVAVEKALDADRLRHAREQDALWDGEDWMH